jgi:hypothetical protein
MKPKRKWDIYDALGIAAGLAILGWAYIVIHFIVKFW